MTERYKAIRIDDENNAEAFWEAIDDQYPTISASLRRNGHAIVSYKVYQALASLPGFSDGPEHARDALIDCGDCGQQFLDIVQSRYEVFESIHDGADPA